MYEEWCLEEWMKRKINLLVKCQFMEYVWFCDAAKNGLKGYLDESRRDYRKTKFENKIGSKPLFKSIV